MDNKPINLKEIFNQHFDRDALVLHEFPETIDKIESIKNKATLIRVHMEAHCNRHWMVWTKKEQDRIFVQRFGDVKPAYTLKDKTMTWEEARRLSFNQARDIINQRIQNRYQRIDTISNNMRERTMQAARQQYEEQGLARQWLDKEVKQIHQTTNTKRMDVYRNFEATKGQRVKYAIAAGSENPERDVYTAYKQQDRDLLSQREHSFRQAYQNHGFNYDNDQHSLKRQFNLVM